MMDFTSFSGSPNGFTDTDYKLLSTPPRPLHGHAKKITCMAWSPTGQILATGSMDTTIRTWTMDTNTLSSSSSPSSPSVGASSGTGTLQAPLVVTTPSSSSSSSSSLPSSSSSSANVTNICRRSEILRGHTTTVDALVWNPLDPPTLASGGLENNNGQIKLWDTRNSKQIGNFTIKGHPLSLNWRSTNDNYIAVGTRQDTFLLIDPRKGSNTNSVVYTHQFPLELNEFAFTPSGLLYASLGQHGITVDEGIVGVYDIQIQNGNNNGNPSQNQQPTENTALPHNNNTNTNNNSTNNNSTVITMNEIVRVKGHTTPIVVLKFDPFYQYFATGASDSVVALWDSQDISVVRTIDRSEAFIRSISFSYTGEYLAIASGDREDLHKTLDIVRVQDGTRVRSLTHFDTIQFVSWAPNCNILAYSYDDPRGNIQSNAMYGNANTVNNSSMGSSSTGGNSGSSSSSGGTLLNPDTAALRLLAV